MQFRIILSVFLLFGLLAGESRANDTKSKSSLLGNGTPLGSTITISNQNGLVETHPATAYNTKRGEYLVVWANDRNASDDIMGQRVSNHGGLIGGAFAIAKGTGADRSKPALVYNSTEDQYLVVWEHTESATGTSVRARRVSGTGLVMDLVDIVVRDAGYNLYTPANPAVGYASLTNKYLSIWDETWHPLPILRTIEGQVVLGTGTLSGNRIPISSDPGSHPRQKPALAYNALLNDYLIVWQQWDPGASLNDIKGRMVKGDGSLTLPESVTIAAISTSTTSPTVATLEIPSKEQFLVVFELHYAPGDMNIYGRYVLAGGVLGSGFYIAWSNQIDENSPSIAPSQTGQYYLVAFNRPSDPPFLFKSINGRTVAAEGGSLGPEISLGGIFADYPSLAAGSFGDFLVVFDDVPLVADSGIYGRLWGNRLYLPLILSH